MHDDKFIGAKGSQIMRGLAGDDYMDGGKGVDSVRYDRDYRYESTDGVTVNLKAGFAIDGFGDRDTLKNFENVRGSDYADKITGSNGKNLLQGGDSNDLLKGLGGNDTLEGGDGNDKLDGGNGNDMLAGGAGFDRFIFSGKFGNDTISDFRTAGIKEKIDLSGVTAIKNFADLMNNHISDIGGHAVINDGAGNTIDLYGVIMDDLAKNDFLF
ncbi:MAG: calcium-binding protein, partial [Pseudodonghicola sp.]